ncbi:hypothetical protein K0M31_014788 [Melipona bicolor]|uniref:Uncharacterized protein n=1 Tax=Melipona bicolor TaxID=60889 RepID=A0AA40FGV6_9HYME|nr:hypothetical protein K0M31_014788 [Melipona bicolor]
MLEQAQCVVRGRTADGIQAIFFLSLGLRLFVTGERQQQQQQQQETEEEARRYGEEGEKEEEEEEEEASQKFPRFAGVDSRKA